MTCSSGSWGTMMCLAASGFNRGTLQYWKNRPPILEQSPVVVQYVLQVEQKGTLIIIKATQGMVAHSKELLALLEVATSCKGL